MFFWKALRSGLKVFGSGTFKRNLPQNIQNCQMSLASISKTRRLKRVISRLTTKAKKALLNRWSNGTDRWIFQWFSSGFKITSPETSRFWFGIFSFPSMANCQDTSIWEFQTLLTFSAWIFLLKTHWEKGELFFFIPETEKKDGRSDVGCLNLPSLPDVSNSDL